MKDLQMIISEMVVGFVEYARADQVRQLDRRTKLTEIHAGIGWHFDLRHLKRKDFFILRFSATVSSFMMKHVENSKKIQYMDASLRS
ncbi:MAG: hypothetical protein K6E76_02595 [Patescibacteria group bacterium]|nr:hypothetical protein [Patescibacteria group bacterium]